jgi:hypothetical protein
VTNVLGPPGPPADEPTVQVMATRRPRRRGRRAWAAVVLAVIMLAPLAALGLLVKFAPNRLSVVNPAPSVLTLPVTTGTDNETVNVTATLTYGSEVTLLAPQWNGIVTAIDVSPGQTVTSGTPILAVDGNTEIALQSSLPFYRPIGPGTDGPDVAALRSALSAIGYGDLGSSTSYGPTLQAAIEDLAGKLMPDASPVPDTFSPSWVVYLPVSSLKVASVSATLGSSAPPPGQGFLTSTSVLQPFSLSPAQGASLPSSSNGYELVLEDGSDIPLQAGFKVSSPSALSTVQQSLSGNPTSLSAQIQLIHPATFQEVPTTAIVTSASGHQCVFLDHHGRLSPVIVKTYSGLPGVVEVTGLAAHTQEVVANPDQVAADRGCS